MKENSCGTDQCLHPKLLQWHLPCKALANSQIQSVSLMKYMIFCSQNNQELTQGLLQSLQILWTLRLLSIFESGLCCLVQLLHFAVMFVGPCLEGHCLHSCQLGCFPKTADQHCTGQKAVRSDLTWLNLRRSQTSHCKRRRLCLDK